MNEQPPTEGAPRKEGRSLKFWLFVAAGVLFLIFVIQNTREVPVEFLFATTDTPLFLALLIAGGLGAVVGWAAPRVRRGGPRD